MKYIMNRIYEGKEVKIRIFFMLLLENKKMFDFLDYVPENLGYLYHDPTAKIERL